jgi:hypothetical protein
MGDRIPFRIAEELSVAQDMVWRCFQQVQAVGLTRREMAFQRPSLMDLGGASRRLAPENQRACRAIGRVSLGK